MQKKVIQSKIMKSIAVDKILQMKRRKRMRIIKRISMYLVLL
jgi:hypothetical protein